MEWVSLSLLALRQPNNVHPTLNIVLTQCATIEDAAMENTFGRPWVITLNREISCQRCKPGHISSRHEDSFNLPKPFKSNMCPCCYNAFTQLSEALASFKPDVDHGQEALIVNYPHHSTTTMLCEAVEVYGCRVCWLLHDVSNDLERRCSVGGAHLQPGDLHMYHSPYKMLGVDLKVRDASFQALVKHLVMENLGSEGNDKFQYKFF